MTELQEEMLKAAGLTTEDFEKPTVTEQDKIMAQAIHSCYDRHADR